MLVWSALAAPLLVLALFAALVGTSGGTAWLLGQVPGLRVSAPQGALLGGRFEAAHVEWSGSPGSLAIEQLRWSDLRWRWRPHAQAWLGVDLVEPRAARIAWQPGEVAAEPRVAPTSLRLPLHARVLELRIDELAIAALPPLREVLASVELGADEGRRHVVQQLSLALDAARLSAHGDIGTDGELPLALRVDAGSSTDRRPAWHGRLDVGGPLQRLRAEARVDLVEPVAGAEARATLAPFAAWPIVDLQFETRDLDLATLAPAAPRTRLSGRVDVRSSSLDAPIEVDVALTNAAPGRWDRRRLPVASLALTVGGRVGEPGTVELRRFDARLDGGGMPAGRWSGHGRWQGEQLTLDTTLAGLRPALLDGRAPPMSLGGPLQLRLGGLPSPDRRAPPTAANAQTLQARAQIEGRHDGLPGAPAVRLDAELAAERSGSVWRAQLRRLEARAGDARAAFTATAIRQGAGAWTLASSGRVDRLDPLPWWPSGGDEAWRRGPHRLNAQWTLDLTLAPQPSLSTTRGQAELAITDSLLAGVPLAGRVKWRHAGEGALGEAEVDLGGNRISARTRGDGPVPSAWHLVAKLPQPEALRPLGRLHPSLERWLPRAGSIDAVVDVEGEWPRLATRGEAQLRAVQAGDLRLARAQARWSATTAPGAQPDAPLQFALDAEDLARGEQRLDRLRVRLDGSWAAHRFEFDASAPLLAPAWLRNWAGAPATSDGSAVRLSGEGRWRSDAGAAASPWAGSWQAQVAELRAAPRDARGEPTERAWVQASDLELVAAFDPDGVLQTVRSSPGRLQLLDTAVRWRELQWQAQDLRPGGAFSVDAELEPLAVASLLDRMQPGFGWGGDLQAGATLRARLAERFDADVVVERRSGDLEIADNGSRQRFGLTDLRLSLSAHDGVWHVTQAAVGSNIGVLGGAQTLRLSPDEAWPTADTPLQGVVELRVDNLGIWAPWLPPGWRLGGSLRTSAQLGGRFGAPEYTGEMVGQRLAVRNLLQGVDVRDGELRVSLRGDDATVETMRFRAGEGSLDVTGGASFATALPVATLRLSADQFQLLGRADRRIVVSGAADVALSGEAIRVDGRFDVDRGLIDFTRRDAPTLDDDVTVVRRGEQLPDTPPTVRTPRRPILVKVAVDLGRQLRIRGRGLDTLLRGNLTLTTPAGRPQLEGTVRAVDGTYQAYGQRLQIDRGTVTFTGPPDNPRLDILAVRPNLDVEVGVEIGGSALTPRVRLYSDPAMSDADTLSWLVLGRAPDTLGRADTALLQGAAMALLAGEGEGTGDRLLRSLGLDQLSFAPSQEGSAKDTVVTVGKQIGRNLFVAYERGVNATSGSWQLIYRVARRITVRAQTGEDTALDVIWTWRWN